MNVDFDLEIIEDFFFRTVGDCCYGCQAKAKCLKEARNGTFSLSKGGGGNNTSKGGDYKSAT